MSYFIDSVKIIRSVIKKAFWLVQLHKDNEESPKNNFYSNIVNANRPYINAN